MNNCKICGHEMENYEWYDSEYDATEHFEFMKAYCPHCKKWYKWVEIYIFDRAEGFEEDA